MTSLTSLLLTIALHVLFVEQTVLQAAVVALVGNVAGSQIGLARRSGGTVDALGPPQRLNIPRQTHAFTCERESAAVMGEGLRAPVRLNSVSSVLTLVVTETAGPAPFLQQRAEPGGV